MKNKNNNLSNEVERLEFINEVLASTARVCFKKIDKNTPQSSVEAHFNNKKLATFIALISPVIERLYQENPSIDQGQLKTNLASALFSKKIVRRGKGTFNTKLSFNSDERNIGDTINNAFTTTDKSTKAVGQIMDEVAIGLFVNLAKQHNEAFEDLALRDAFNRIFDVKKPPTEKDLQDRFAKLVGSIPTIEDLEERLRRLKSNDEEKENRPSGAAKGPNPSGLNGGGRPR